jgi:hypothetical protein
MAGSLHAADFCCRTFTVRALHRSVSTCYMPLVALDIFQSVYLSI